MSNTTNPRCSNYDGLHDTSKPDEISNSDLIDLLVCECGAPIELVRYRKWDHDGSYQYRAKCTAKCGYPPSHIKATENEALADYYT